MPLVRRRPLLRAAAVGAVGYSAAKAGTRSAQNEQQQQAEQGQYQQEQMAAQQQMVPPPPPPTYAQQPAQAPAAAPDRVSQLQELAKLHDSGALTDAEFQQEKQRILNS
jgi:hypothetical protein